MYQRFLQIVFLVLLSIAAQAQDPQFSQFYAAPLYHNPAMAGGAFRDRVVLNHRTQWPSLPKAFVTFAASYDHYSKRYNSGFGLLATTDRAGAGSLRSSSLTGMYSYQLAFSPTWALRAGLQFGYGNRSLDYHKLTFGDQLDLDLVRNGIQLGTSDPTQFNAHNVSYFEAGSGLLLYSSHFWFGAAAQHLNQPNQSLTEQESRLPMRLNFNAGAKIPLEKKAFRRSARFNVPEKSITPAVLYKYQGEFDQLDMGIYLHYNPMVVGLWYRGLPVKNYRKGIYNHDALVVLLGWKWDNMSFGYSYDVTISALGPKTGGAHEISLAYEFDTKGKRKKKPRLIPCPKY